MQGFHKIHLVSNSQFSYFYIMYNSSKGYAAIKAATGKMLVQKGFCRSKTAIWYRITPDNILQFVNPQKGFSSLGNHMTFNIVIQALFSPICSFGILTPGGQIGSLLADDKRGWWPCDSEESTNSSIADITNVFTTTLLPFFDNLATGAQLADSQQDASARFIWHNHYTFITKGYVCLWSKRYTEAMSIFEANRPSQVAKFKTIKGLVTKAKFSEIDKLLLENISFNKQKLEI
jgi:hypothetical protein